MPAGKNQQIILDFDYNFFCDTHNLHFSNGETKAEKQLSWGGEETARAGFAW